MTALISFQASRHSFCLMNARISEHVKSKIKTLDNLEFPESKCTPSDVESMLAHDIQELRTYRESFKNDHTLMGRIKRIIVRILILFRIQPSAKLVDQILFDYELRLNAFRYRKDLWKKEDRENVDPELVKRLENAVLDFKKRHRYSETQKKTLYGHDRKQIRKMAQYKPLTELLLTNPERLDHLFKFVIRNLYSVSCFMRFPETSENLYQFRVAQQVNAWHGVKHIKRLKGIAGASSVGIRFAHENRFVDILREKEVNVTENSRVPIKDIFKDFKSQSYRHGDYSVLRNGIAYWAIDKSWLDGMNENIYDIVGFDELKQMFSDLKLGDHIVSFAGTRESEGRDIRNSHGFVRYRRPCGDDPTKYEVLSFGVYAKKWPKNVWEFIGFMGNTAEASWCFPDPNAKYSQRLVGEIVRIFNPDNPEIDRIETAFEKTIRDPNLIFQFCGHNCAYEAEKLVMGCREPSLILIPIDEVITPAFFKIWTIPFTLTPSFLKPAMMKVIVLTLGGFRTLHGMNLFNAQVATSGKFNYPGLIKELVESGQQTGIVFGGHNRDLEAVTL